MELAAFAIIGVVVASWIVGIIRLVRCGRYWWAFLSVVLPFPGMLVALYGLFASPRPGSAIHRRNQIQSHPAQ